MSRLRWTFFGAVGVKQPELFAGLTLVLAVLFVGFLAGDLFARDHWPYRKAVAT